MFKDKRYIIAGIITLVLAVGVVGVKAASRIASVTINNVENLTMNVEGSTEEIDEMIGASGTRYPHGISADSTSPSTGEVRGATLTTTGAATIGGAATLSSTLSVTGATSYAGQVKNTPAFLTATTTLTSASANIQLLSASAVMNTITLPAVTATGTFFRIQVDGALTGSFVLVDSAEGDNISGTLIVAGAVVDCRDEDQINIITDGEAIGDYVEFMSSGSQWLLVDSGVLTAGKMTCTDPS